MTKDCSTVKTVAFYTLGCKVNQYDTEAMKEAFLERGFSIVEFSSCADVYVINTCTVTGRSDAKSRQAVRRARRRNPQALVAVTGCYSQVDSEAITAIEGVDVVAGTNLGRKIVDLVDKAHSNRIVDVTRQHDWHSIRRFGDRTRAAIKVQEGCEQFCSYCIVPVARGKLRSRDASEVVDQVKRLTDAGFKEIVLTGVHLGAYGRETSGALQLPELIRMVGQVKGLRRLRLSSIEPIDLREDLFDALKETAAFCEHLHMPLQSGSDAVLNAMRRPYSCAEFAKVVETARRTFPEIAISTDIIAGFPGETEAQHRQTMRFIEEMAFSRLHVFGFSSRKGTRAATMPDKVAPKVISRRKTELIALGKRLMHSYHTKSVGRTLEVLIEESSRPPRLSGLSRNYIRVACAGDDSHVNQIVSVCVQAATEKGCTGKIVSKSPSGGVCSNV